MNMERAKAGLQAVTLATEISQVVMVRANEIQRSFAHTRPDGRSFSTAITEVNILNPRFKKPGVGHTMDAFERQYWSQLFIY